MDLAEFVAARLDEDEGTVKRDLAHGAWRPEYERARREVTAKRAILKDHWPDLYGCQVCVGDARCPLNHLAAIYSDHPDYREEWAP